MMGSMLLESVVNIAYDLGRAGLVILVAIIVRFLLVFAIKRITTALLNRDPNAGLGQLSIRAKRVLAQAGGVAVERHRQRVGTLGSLLRNIVDVVIVAITLLTVLAILGVPMAPLLASAGVSGLAIGFGAQSLVKDYLSGIFMLAEDQFGVGDTVTIGELRGEVLEVTLRITKLRTVDGVIWYVRNGEMLTVGNISQGYSTAFVKVPVAIDENPERVQQVLDQALGGMADEDDWNSLLLEDPLVLGVDSLEGGTMNFNIMLKTGPDQHWGAMREVRRRARRAFAAEGIRRPILPGTSSTPPQGT